MKERAASLGEGEAVVVTIGMFSTGASSLELSVTVATVSVVSIASSERGLRRLLRPRCAGAGEGVLDREAEDLVARSSFTKKSP